MLELREISRWLREDDPEALEELWRLADEMRRLGVGDEVHLRGLIEISNRCVRSCLYCGLRRENLGLARYRLSIQEILDAARLAGQCGCGTVVLQAGEDPYWNGPRVAELVRLLKAVTGLAVTLSLGEKTPAELELWRKAGADRYLLRFETSRRDLFERIHPPLGQGRPDRLALLRVIKSLGYETGSGVMVGIPGQTRDDLARDIELFGELELDMIGVGPYLPHPDTPLAGAKKAPADQVPNDETTTCKAIALARLVRPLANIPSTTALATLNREKGRELGLARGANVVMPSFTPADRRALYEIYPDKACIYESNDFCMACLGRRIESLGRRVGVGRGDSPGCGAGRKMAVNL
jgi:biotin synthase